MGKNLLYIMLNRACNCACENCCTESSPDCYERLDYESVKKFIQHIEEDKNLTQIVFTGGEPFFYYEDLKKYISLVGEKGKKIACMTNGYWAENFDDAYEKLMELKKEGLCELILSYDYYHKEYISPLTIRNAIKAAQKANIEVFLYVINAKNHSIREWMDEINNIDQISSTVFRSCLPVGNAKINLAEDNYIRNIDPVAQCCQSQNKMLVKYDGTILPCIYAGMLHSGIKIGNYEQLTYQQAKHRIEDDIILKTIRNYGFDPLIEYAKNEMDLKIPEKIVSKCEICAILFTKENIERFYQHFNTVENHRVIHIS